MCLGVFFFVCILLGVHWASWICGFTLFFKIGSTPVIIFLHFFWYSGLKILACGIPELWHDSSILRDHLTVLGSHSRHCRLGGSKRKYLQAACWGSLSGLLSFLPLSQDQSHAACCPVYENCCSIYSIQLSGPYYSITSRNRATLGHLKATV